MDTVNIIGVLIKYWINALKTRKRLERENSPTSLPHVFASWGKPQSTEGL